MKFVDEFRDATLAKAILDRIQRQSTRRWVIMEVCGGQTHGLLKYGIDELLHDTVELIHGPGCPVCVTDAVYVDLAVQLSLTPGFAVATFGDMLRVPGTAESLAAARGRGGRVREFYSPCDAVQWANEEPELEVVFFAVGFETTAPSTALAVLQAQMLGLRNFSVLACHVRVEPAMDAVMASSDNRVQGFLAAGHVCSITGWDTYSAFVQRWRVPVIVTGFEPVDLLAGIAECVQQLESGNCEVINCYGRSVTSHGNRDAQAMIDHVYVPCDRPWRGLGTIPSGGLQLRDEYLRYDAIQKFGLESHPEESHPQASACRAGEVLSGRIKPCDCREFGIGCRPEHPLGAPMVSSEGACSAWFRYRHREANVARN